MSGIDPNAPQDGGWSHLPDEGETGKPDPSKKWKLGSSGSSEAKDVGQSRRRDAINALGRALSSGEGQGSVDFGAVEVKRQTSGNAAPHPNPPHLNPSSDDSANEQTGKNQKIGDREIKQEVEPLFTLSGFPEKLSLDRKLKDFEDSESKGNADADVHFLLDELEVSRGSEASGLMSNDLLDVFAEGATINEDALSDAFLENFETFEGMPEEEIMKALSANEGLFGAIQDYAPAARINGMLRRLVVSLQEGDHDGERVLAELLIGQMNHSKVSLEKLGEEKAYGIMVNADPEMRARLEYLDFGSMDIGEDLIDFPGIEQSFPFVKHLGVHSDMLQDSDLEHLKMFISLNSLDLSGCRSLTDDGLVHIEEIGLIRVNFANCNFTDNGIGHLKDMPLAYINLATCEIGDKAIMNFKDKALVEVDLSGTNITNKSLSYFQGMPLVHLDISECYTIDDDGLSFLEFLKLSFLSMADCENITDTGVGFLTNMSLESLNLSGCICLTNESLDYIDRRRLKYLNLSKTGVDPLAFVEFVGLIECPDEYEKSVTLRETDRIMVISPDLDAHF